MSQTDDFDIVRDEEEEQPQRPVWFWIAAIIVVALFAFAVGVAFMILSDRLDLGPAAPNPTTATAGAVVTGTQAAQIDGNITVTVTPSPTNPTVTVTPTPTVTVTPQSTPTPDCEVPVAEVFLPIYNQERFGCATWYEEIVWAAWQPFEDGSMLWRSDTDRAYVFYANDEWFEVNQGWDGAPPADRGEPPPGLQAPERGFGYVWGRSDEIFERLGWATDREKGFCALLQRFEYGFILRSSDVESCTPENLYNHAAAADWDPVLLAASEDNIWSNAPDPEQSTSQGGDRNAAALTRPAPQGYFEAPRLTGAALDGSFTEWPAGWMPINNIVLGLDQHDGPGDFSANFQVAWNEDGLLLAVRVNDEQYRPGPSGSNLWQGDSIEVQFDRRLSADFDSTQADGDDIQMGLAFDEDLTNLRGYQWLPFDRESELGIPGSVVATERGYVVEAQLPWGIFELDASTISTNQAYGFNLSINDRDGETPAQETVLSSSPARTTHDNPTEWGTLRLLP